MASSLQTDEHGRANRKVKFFIKGKNKKQKTKFQIVKPGAQIYIIAYFENSVP